MKRSRGEPWAWELHSNGENQRGGPSSSPTRSLASSKKSDKLLCRSGLAVSAPEYGFSTTSATVAAPFSYFLNRRPPTWVFNATDLTAVTLCVRRRGFDFELLKTALESRLSDETGEKAEKEPSSVTSIGEKLERTMRWFTQKSFLRFSICWKREWEGQTHSC